MPSPWSRSSSVARILVQSVDGGKTGGAVCLSGCDAMLMWRDGQKCLFRSPFALVQELNLPGEPMYGSPVSKDLNLPVQPPMASSGLLRYRSAPSTVLGDLCEDFLSSAPRAASPDAGADNVFSRFLADHHIRDDKPSPLASAAVHFPTETDTASQQQQQQMMFHSQQQQEMVSAKSGLYRTVNSGVETAAAAGAGGASSSDNASNLIRQSSSPAGFLDHLNMENGWPLPNSPSFSTTVVTIPCLFASLPSIIDVIGGRFSSGDISISGTDTERVPTYAKFAQFRIRGHAEGGHGHGGLPRRRRQQAKRATELLVTAGVIDVPDLRDGERGGRREQPRGFRRRRQGVHPWVPNGLWVGGLVGSLVRQFVWRQTPPGLVGAWPGAGVTHSIIHFL
jgi:hypothetical protein